MYRIFRKKSVTISDRNQKWENEQMNYKIEDTKIIDFLMQLSMLSGVSIEIRSIRELQSAEESAFDKLRQSLVSLARQQDEPVLFEDKHHVLWMCILIPEHAIFLGPVVLNPTASKDLRYDYPNYIPVLPLRKIVVLLHLITNELGIQDFSEEKFLQVNHRTEKSVDFEQQELSKFQIKEDMEEKYHHTYQEEQKLLNCVREGRLEEALTYNLDIDMGTGRLSKREVDHWKKVVIVAITLCTRAAIEGGISPSIAYQLSDYYIQKCDQYSNISELIICRNKAVSELTKQVQRKRDGHKTSSYVEQCKDYIRKNYKEKIYLKEMADMLGLNSTYLSRLFSKETGMTLQEYINWFKIERAVNLLIYSDESIAHISEYVHFPSQSYFGRVFKKYKHTTPGEYRNQNKPKEFTL